MVLSKTNWVWHTVHCTPNMRHPFVPEIFLYQSYNLSHHLSLPFLAPSCFFCSKTTLSFDFSRFQCMCMQCPVTSWMLHLPNIRCWKQENVPSLVILQISWPISHWLTSLTCSLSTIFYKASSDWKGLNEQQCQGIYGHFISEVDKIDANI